MSPSTTTPTAEAPRAPSIRGTLLTARVQVGDIVLVRVEEGVYRPLLVTVTGMVTVHDRATPTVEPHSREVFRISGTIFCEPDDHARPLFRGWTAGGTDPARVTGRPDRLLTLAYGEYLVEGPGVGQWMTRPTNLPARS